MKKGGKRLFFRLTLLFCRGKLNSGKSFLTYFCKYIKVIIII